MFFHYRNYSITNKTQLVVLCVERHEADMFLIEEELDTAGGTTAVLGYDEIGDVLVLGIWIVVILAVKEHDDIGILLDRTRFAEIGEHWDLRTA